jgi:hypothetical protein
MLEPSETEWQNITRTVFGEGVVSHATGSRFKAYFNHYCSVVCPGSSGDAVIELDTPALRGHADVLNCIDVIFQDPKVSFNGFITKTIGSHSAEASGKEKEHVARVAAEVAFAINCMYRDYYSDKFIHGDSYHAKWEGDTSFLCFIENAFLLGSQESQAPKQQQRNNEMMAHKSSLKAWKLSKRYGIKIKGTNNLLEHLLLDSKTMTLKIFHQISFLRAHLVKSKQEPLDLNFEESLKRLSPLIQVNRVILY